MSIPFLANIIILFFIAWVSGLAPRIARKINILSWVLRVAFLVAIYSFNYKCIMFSYIFRLLDVVQVYYIVTSPALLLNILKFCIKIGVVNVNAVPWTLNLTLLHLAAGEGRHKVVKMLIDNGADVNAMNSWNETPLNYVVSHLKNSPEIIDIKNKEDILEVIKILCKNGANVNAKNDLDCSPVDIALEHEDYKLLHLLIPFNASIPIWG